VLVLLLVLLVLRHKQYKGAIIQSAERN